MIYLIDSNKIVSSLQGLDIKNYEFYKEGCAVNPQKLSKYLKSQGSNCNKPIIGKLKKSASKNQQHQASKQDLQKLLTNFQQQQKQQFETKKSILFEQSSRFKFKFISPGDKKGSNMTKEDIMVLKQKFLNTNNNKNKLNKNGEEGTGYDLQGCSEEQLDYVIYNWREFVKEAAVFRILL